VRPAASGAHSRRGGGSARQALSALRIAPRPLGRGLVVRLPVRQQLLRDAAHERVLCALAQFHLDHLDNPDRQLPVWQLRFLLAPDSLSEGILPVLYFCTRSTCRQWDSHVAIAGCASAVAARSTRRRGKGGVS